MIAQMQRALALFVMLSAGAVAAQERVPGYLKPEVMEAAAAINLTAAQQTQFRATVSAFLDDRMRAINTLMRKHNQTGLQRKIKSRTNSLLKQMDESAAGYLTEEQMPAYEHYRDTLKANLWGM